ncbi:MAG: phasin family protein [Aquisalimonadaceae bacterium]
MYEEFFKNTGNQFETWVAPARKLNSLIVEHLAKVSEFQMEAARAYSDLSVEQLRAMTKINDAKSLQDFVSNQSKLVKTLSEKVSQDTNTLAGFGKDLTAELQKLAQENVAAASKAAKAA